MEKRQFKAESKRLLELMVNSIYTHKEIFLRELISNASDALDKMYFRALTDEAVHFSQDDYYIKIDIDREKRLLTVADTGIGMTREELDENLGVIARSGTSAFRDQNELGEEFDIIGQFGVGFYSAFMVADRVTVISKALGGSEAYKWESEGVEGYTIDPWEKQQTGTEIILKIKDDTDDDKYGQYLEEYRLKALVKRYSDFIRYPIKMNISGRRLKEGSESEYEEYTEEQTVNSMVPIWKKNKTELSPEDYENFYREKHYGFDRPLRHLHISTEGAVSYRAILFIPEKAPFDFYSREYEKGLELYSRGVLIMDKCPDLLPDYFSFIKGMVDSEDLSLNISREMLQHDRQLKQIAGNIRNKIKSELESMIKDDRENYEKFYESFGRQLKFGIYADFGANRNLLQDLIMFYSSKDRKMVTLGEYAEAMPEGQKYIYYAAGESRERIEKMPQTETVADRGYDILYFTDDVDEFAIKVLREFRDKEFRSVAGGDLGLEDENKEESAAAARSGEENRELFERMKSILDGRVKEVRASRRLKTHPVCLANEGDVSVEMEKILGSMPGSMDIKADKVLEINVGHQVFESLQTAFTADEERFKLYTRLLYNQAALIDGLPIDDPVEFADDICRAML